MQNKAYEFDDIAQNVFFPIYSVIAKQIREKTGIDAGTCLDIGCGGGHLGLSMAQITKLNLTLLDKNEYALDIARNRAKEWELEDRASTLLGDACSIPLENETMDLCISRGSVWFWEDREKAFSEIYRVLKYGGKAYIGGGFGSNELIEKINVEMKKRDNEWPKSRQKFVDGTNRESFTKWMKAAHIEDFEIIDDEKGIWVVINKTEDNKNLQATAKPNFLGYTFCPMKQTFKDCFEMVLKENEELYSEDDFNYYIPSGCSAIDPYENMWRAKTVDELPEVIVSTGLWDYFNKYFVEKFIEKDYFEAIKFSQKTHKIFLEAGFEDPDNHYTVYSVFPLVFLVDRKRLGELPVPKKWEDLLNPVYKDNIILGASHGEIHEDVMYYIFKDYGEEGLKKLAHNVKDAYHAAQMAKTAGTNKSEGAAIYVIPWMFARACPKTDIVEMVWPEDGAICTPLYLLVKKGSYEKYKPFIDMIMGAEYGQKSANNYFPALNPAVKNKFPDGAALKWMGWEYIKNNPIDELTEKVVRIFKKYWGKTVKK